VSGPISFHVRYAETDAQHVVYYANHVAWFELGYEALFAAAGRPLGVDRPKVLEAACRYRAPIRYGETVTVQSRPVLEEDTHLWVAHTLRVGEEVRATGATLLADAAGLVAPLDPGDLERFDGWERLAPHGRCEVIPLRVRYAESEPTRGVHFARYFGWFEVGRIAFLHRIGLDYARMETTGSPFVIAWAGCRYLAPVYFDDPLEIAVWVEQVRQR
jgi:acyl-CoA thioesterase FadM